MEPLHLSDNAHGRSGYKGNHASIEASGEFILTKPPGSGGAVNRETVAEQRLYEVGDPAAYLTPDVVADFTRVALTELGRDEVRITGAHGKPATDSYKAAIAYRDGWTSSGTLVLAGPGAATKARRCGDILFARLRRAGVEPQHRNIECLGTGACVPGVSPPTDAPEVVLRITVRPRPKRLLPIANLLSYAVFPAVIWEQEGTTPTVLAGLAALVLILVRRLSAGIGEDLATGAPAARRRRSADSSGPGPLDGPKTAERVDGVDGGAPLKAGRPGGPWPGRRPCPPGPRG